MALPKSHEQRSIAVTIPDDIDAFRTGLTIDTEWSPFERSKDSPRGWRRYAYAEPSDKGRYLLAVLERFETLPDAFAVLMNGYWRDVLISLGAVPVEKNTGLRGDLISTLRKRLRRSGQAGNCGDERYMGLLSQRYNQPAMSGRKTIRWQDEAPPGLSS